MKPPRSGIHIQELVQTVSWVALEFDLRKTVVVHRSEKLQRELEHFRTVHRFNERRGSAEFRRMLTPASGFHAREGFAVLEEHARGVLRLTAARNDLLN